MHRFGAIVRLAVVSIGVFALTNSAVKANSIRSVTLKDLFEQADAVVLVKTVAGDTEHYDSAVYKAVVEARYKGADTSTTIYFGPFIGYGIGTEYILFLKAGAGAKPKNDDGLSFGDIPTIGKIMYDGYAALAVGYECVFDGSAISKQCDDSVQVNPEQILIPKTIATFPKGEADARTNYKKWVRKSALLRQLELLVKTKVNGKP